MDKLQVKNGQFTIDSREVAEMVEKEHAHLMRDIRGYVDVIDNGPNPELDSAHFFIESTYFDRQNQERPCYLITRKGCDMVANKMTGEKGVLFTATYVTKFEEMERQQKPLQIDSKFLFQLATQLEEKEKEVKLLTTENKLLSQETLTWTNRKLLEAIVKKYGAYVGSIKHIGKEGFMEAWREFKKELLYRHSININSRITSYMNNSGKRTKPSTLSMIHDDELSKCISTAVSLCKANGVDISDIIGKYTA